MKHWRCCCFLAIVLLQPPFLPELRAQWIAISYPDLYRVAPKLAGIDIKKHLYFAPVQRLKEEGYIDRLYK